MRKTLLAVALAWCAGFVCASVAVHAYTKLNAWQSFGEKFQLGYVVGYIDAVKLAKFKDPRATIPTAGRARPHEWVAGVNAFYEDSANAGRPVPDAMSEFGDGVKQQILEAYRQRRNRSLEAAKGARESGPSGVEPEPAPELQ